MNRTVRFWQVGSDHEALFVSVPKGERTVRLRDMAVVNAQSFITGIDGQGDVGSSFIGCDGHYTTAELRPPPAHNVTWHLMYIANAMGHIRKNLGTSTRMIAQPSFRGETMGGHIWTSMFYRSELSHRAVNVAGYVHNGREMVASKQSLPRRMSSEQVDQAVRAYKNAVAEGRELNLATCWAKLHYLLGPLEKALFGGRRHRRDQSTSDLYSARLPNGAGPDSEALISRPGEAYIRFEYRYPSTALSHPKIAYAYFGLAKLAVLNWDGVPVAHNNKDFAFEEFRGTSEADSGGLLRSRLSLVSKSEGFRITPDLRRLGPVLDEILAKGYIPPRAPLFVDFDAWAQLDNPVKEERQ